MKKYDGKERLEDLIAASPVFLLEFGSQTCGPCGAIRDKLSSWCSAEAMADAVYIQVEEFPEIAAQAGVFSVPTIIAFVEGKAALQVSGYFSLEDFLAKVQRYVDVLQE